MSERITEAEPQRWSAFELAALERQAKQSQLPGADPIVEAFAGNCVHLVAEVRRLRRVILSYDTPTGCYARATGCDCESCLAFEAEARAIKSDQAFGVTPGGTHGPTIPDRGERG